MVWQVFCTDLGQYASFAFSPALPTFPFLSFLIFEEPFRRRFHQFLALSKLSCCPSLKMVLLPDSVVEYLTLQSLPHAGLALVFIPPPPPPQKEREHGSAFFLVFVLF